MRITRVAGHNFRSYTDFDLDLSPVQHGVLTSGATGSGKSSLIDCLMWVLYGRTRSRSANSFVKIGRDEAWGEVEWNVNGGTHYRVHRSVSLKTSRPKSDLQFACLNGKGAWTPLGGKTIAETEGKIECQIGQSFETLTTGNFALQGDSGKFTKAPVSERISVLAELLGLGVYQEWREEAGKGVRSLDQQATTLEAQVVASDGELAKRPGLEVSLQAAVMTQEESHDKQAALSLTIEQATQDLAERRGTLDPLRRELAGFAESRQTLWTKNRALGEKSARVDTLTTLLSRRAEIEQAAAKVAELDALLATQRQELAGLEAEGEGVRVQVTTAEAGLKSLDGALAQAILKVEGAHGKVANRPALEAKVARLGTARTEREDVSALKAHNEKVITGKNTDLSRIMSANLEAQRKAGEIEAEARKTVAEAKGLAPRIADFERRAETMEHVPCIGVAIDHDRHPGDGAFLSDVCPLLADARQAGQDVAPLNAQHATLCAWVRPTSPPQQDTGPLRAEIAKIEAALAADRKTLAALETEIASLQPAEAELASLDTVQATIPGLEADEAAARTARDAAVLEAANLRGSLKAVGERWHALKSKVDESELKRDQLAPTAALAPELAHADADLPGLQADVAALTAEIQTLQAALDREATVKATLAESERFLTAMTSTLSLQRAELEQHKRTEASALQEAATLRAGLGALDKLATDRDQAACEAARLREEHTTLVALELAYRQCPLMILENEAIPEIEQAADAVLARISPSGIRVNLRTQREIKSRDTLADGLDIIIRDQVGEREYEAYSGGQQFQIDLALRVGLSKLQARRAGAVIETLVVDEGFGTQSAECLDGIVTALRAVQADFPLLWCISHVEALRDVFPAQIRVAGGPRDSVAELVMG